MAYVIKRYSNRKLYDTQESRYVTLEEIEQIILEHERNHRGTLPTGFLHQLIKHGEAWQDFVQRSMRSSLEGIVGSQREMERVFREWSSRAGWGPPGGGEVKRESAEPDAERLREEVSSLRERLRALEERLEKRRSERN